MFAKNEPVSVKNKNKFIEKLKFIEQSVKFLQNTEYLFISIRLDYLPNSADGCPRGKSEKLCFSNKLKNVYIW